MIKIVKVCLIVLIIKYNVVIIIDLYLIVLGNDYL